MAWWAGWFGSWLVGWLAGWLASAAISPCPGRAYSGNQGGKKRWIYREGRRNGRELSIVLYYRLSMHDSNRPDARFPRERGTKGSLPGCAPTTLYIVVVPPSNPSSI
ncbi:hypothetical protein IWZ03DRAFT_383511 [Phyllosticta citriasiana]|uniref:Secreted protein n=1 Tax=Phyllosticta citriasiana TaxID=595635 RepID=A0ABR1KGJ4_9PEZI